MSKEQNENGSIDHFPAYVGNNRAAEVAQPDVHAEPVPSAGWREIAAALHVSPGLGECDAQERAETPDPVYVSGVGS